MHIFTGLITRPSVNVLIKSCVTRPLSLRTLHANANIRYSKQEKSVAKKSGQSVEYNSLLTVPNILTLSRIATTPFIGHFIITSNLTPALSLFAYCCVTDYLDGYIARKHKLKSIAGTILDPIADKLLMVITTIALSFPPGPCIIPWPIASLILGRDIALGVAGMWIRYSTVKKVYKKVNWGKYFNFTKYPTVVVKPLLISKWNTFLQMIYLGTGVAMLLFDKVGDEDHNNDQLMNIKQKVSKSFNVLGYVVGATTLISGTSYIFSRTAVKFLY
ncbi:hypothetical protein KAFR_0L01350 [Kazachstania africana CBS 2517]|uniref:CDP-diacylglycerol--glycerol-3-phosphate 3-phosphatidyltransferase n=1 Tax=Kazachstania africana (strain ATCC 22294 / BCRC 22015 / CBS 2517 / CECT 1963 / NBRC 1671 / NRRL Y-8276) TaxID=1071382 RepID=H2B294_KAZAF|nr:hypothetical protein KAFR_0L01350 [Kazachstania africana CBS 2517]CCF60744.1 hypothetical protein KAFR_0L01350 [Kazachstania africana CBS 2517]